MLRTFLHTRQELPSVLEHTKIWVGSEQLWNNWEGRRLLPLSLELYGNFNPHLNFMNLLMFPSSLLSSPQPCLYSRPFLVWKDRNWWIRGESEELVRSYSLTTLNISPWVLHINYTHLVQSLFSKRGIFSRINHRNDPTLSLKSQAFLVKSFALFLIEQTLKGTEKNPQAHRNREKMGLIWPISLPKNFTEQMEPI